MIEKTFKYRFITFILKNIATLSLKNRLRFGAFLAWLFPFVAKRRAHIIATNLRLCFPDTAKEQLKQWKKNNIRLTAQSFIDRAVLWYAPIEKVKNIATLEGLEHLLNVQKSGEPLLILAPHFLGLDVVGSILSMHIPESCTIYKPQRDITLDTIVRQGRGRFNTVHLLSHKKGFRGMIRYLRDRIAVYYLPDMDFGTKESIFVPFFDIPSATLPTTAHIAKTFKAKVCPIVTSLDINSGTYRIRVLPPLEDFPGKQSIEQATAHVNYLLQEWIREDPSQYYWVHRRFKTRPEGEPEVY